MISLEQHQIEIRKNLQAWRQKPLLQDIYQRFYQRILTLINPSIPGRIVEIGSGIGNLKHHLPTAVSTDLFPNPWLDLVCDGYELPFANQSLSHLVLLDVFHHLRAPRALLLEAARVLHPQGRVILFEPYISLASFPVYGLLHHEPVAWRQPIAMQDHLDRPRNYYAAQGNATRLFFNQSPSRWLQDWKVFHQEAFSSFAYLLSGGYSKPALYPRSWIGFLHHCDHWLSRFPALFGARCLVGLEPSTPAAKRLGTRLPSP